MLAKGAITPNEIQNRDVSIIRRLGFLVWGTGLSSAKR